jgi:hypothetical protein
MRSLKYQYYSVNKLRYKTEKKKLKSSISGIGSVRYQK